MQISPTTAHDVQIHCLYTDVKIVTHYSPELGASRKSQFTKKMSSIFRY